MTSDLSKTMEAHDLFSAGKLRDAISAMNAEIRKNPADADRRSYLSDLLCLAGDFERADIQIEAIAKLVPGALAGVALAKQLIRAAQWRQDTFLEGRVPEFLEAPGERLTLHLQALTSLRASEHADAADALKQAEEMRDPLGVKLNGQDVDDFRDGDDLVGGILELLTSTGKYYWIPWERVEHLEMRPIERPRDLRWRRAGIQVQDGPDGEVYLPAIYAPALDEEDAMLGRVTHWGDQEPIRGQGLRTFVAGEDAVTIHELNEFESKA